MKRIHEILETTAAAHPDSPALVDHEGRTLTYSGLETAVDEATRLLRQTGVRGGDRVMIIGENCIPMVAFLFAASRCDAWAVPVNARMAPGELDRIRAHADPRVSVVTTSVSENAASHAARLGSNTVSGEFGTVGITGARDCTPEPVHEAARDQVAVLMYTTGTTGDPKGVMLTHGNLIFAGRTSANVRNLRFGDLIYGALPISHIFGLASALTACLTIGATLKLQPRFTPQNLYEALMDGVSVLPAVPQMHALLMQYVRENDLGSLNAPALRYVSSGAAPLDPDWKRRAEAFYGVAMQNGYGMTESTAGISTTKVTIGDPDISVGQALPETEVTLVPAPGQDALQDGVGEILTRGPHVMKGYYKNPAETAKVLRDDGFLHTGDLGRFDERGNLSVVGRCKELIIRGGFNIYPPEVEAALNDHPAVVQAAVIGRKLAGGNEEVLAFVQVANPDATTEADLKAHLKDRLAPYKHPSRIVLTEALPAASTGKILKHQLTDVFKAELG